MPLIHQFHDSLQFLDALPADAARVRVDALVQAELAAVDTSALHPSIPTGYAPVFSPLIEQEHARLARDSSGKLNAIDLSRYEALDAPVDADGSRDEQLELWRETLRKAYSSSSYLSSRLTNLGLLETFGKNAWLVGNANLEDILKSLESELTNAKNQVEIVDTQRRLQQEGVRGEIEALDDGWQKGISRMLETEVAAEMLRRQILEKQRAGAV